MDFVTRSMTQADAIEIASWNYEPPYDLYNMGATKESVRELLNGSYWVIGSTDGRTIGFYCVGDSAQVPAGHTFDAYRYEGKHVVDFGIGMRPDLTGRGWGSPFLNHVLQEVVACYPFADLRLTVAAFNQRAIKLYRRFGFQYQAEFSKEGLVFQTMLRRAQGR
ncbi:MAG: GNAT family N-acetyltransferase [Alicyclobacillus macrosporangiidus]|uniref:GNAT family N-acetyltransferase n=1 Tax=Alicyclobacillus macrosporangiidus TaxID=392015 RepID=UPI0026EC7478|nr:GNAT family N-acetyltransferase [Alicyclobacillus macrosporangiidus]MCL6600331.1 GNAT family N-acetyltransferase [Alicyclobacillus macrosporangiidus]